MLKKFMSRAHLYAGLFISPFVVLFALTAVGFNHALGPGAGEAEKTGGFSVKADLSLDNLPLAQDILKQLGIEGEISYVGRNAGSLYIPVVMPGKQITVNVDLGSSTASVTRARTGLYGALLHLHNYPGPHNIAVRGNWWPTKVWRLLSDSTALLILFLTASGVYLWLVMGVPRRTGLMLAGLGVLGFAVSLILMA